MKATVTCPKCQSTEIFTDAGLPKRGDRASVPVTSWAKVFVNVYVCGNCGYMEEYLEMKDKDAIDKLKKSWNRLNK